MKVAMPQGSSHGWGIAGNNLTLELSKLPSVDGVTLHCIKRHDFSPYEEREWNRINIGYCFFEEELLAHPFMAQAAVRWDHIVAGSTWCEQHLRKGGVERVSTILQGVDHARFNPRPPRSDDGRFIVFSGGKFEFRKGQDIVIAAMRAFMERHNDVWLSCAWHNHWPFSLKTMEQSPFIGFEWKDAPCQQLLLETIVRNGLDPHRTILHPSADNALMPLIYAESDIGVFPNRCEGGNNLVLCEYMSCGRTVIASDRTGHADVVTPENAFCLTSYTPRVAQRGNEDAGVWPEASPEELLELLEKAYQERKTLQLKAEAAARDMSRLTWHEAALQFHSIAVRLAQAGNDPSTQSADKMRAKAEEYFASSNYENAESVYRQLLRAFPLDAELYNSLGTVLDREERYQEAICHYHKAICLDDRLSVARYNLANTLRRIGDDDGALDVLQHLAEREPGLLEPWKAMAMIHISRNAMNEAASCFEKVIALAPEDVETRCALGSIYGETGRFTDAVSCLESALKLDPHHLLTLETLGSTLHELDELYSAEECFRFVLSLDPNRVSALNNLGTVVRSLARIDEAVEIFDRALALSPHNQQIRFNRAVARLARGDLPEAWEDYEARFGTGTRFYHPELPRWDGKDLEGKTLLVHSEQGLGDTFQFVRYLPLVSSKGGTIVFECQNRSIAEALHGIDGITIIPRGQSLPRVDCQIPLASLPLLFGTTINKIPFPGGYLKPPRKKAALWAERLSGNSGKVKIGIVWGGNKYSLNANRSLNLLDLSPLFELPSIDWYSLQLGDDAGQLALFEGRIWDLGRDINDFGDTAGIIANLDLVLTIDTSVAHLAGALGAPVWIMLKYSPDWRWFLKRQDSPWYRSATLFRQMSPGDWGAVVTAVSSSLQHLLYIQK